MPMKMWGPIKGPMKGIVSPSTASRISSETAAPPVRRALPATPSRLMVGLSLYTGAILGSNAYAHLTAALEVSHPALSRDLGMTARFAAMRKSSVSPAMALFPLRLFLGITFVYAGVQKLSDPGFLHAGAPTYIGTQLHGFASGT